MAQRSMLGNAAFNMVKVASTMLFPLLTYPYVTRVLLAENLGKVNFSASIVSYITLIAALGIVNYATREGAAVRGDRAKLSEFSSQVFTINLASTVIAYLFLFVLVLAWPMLQSYSALLAIQSIGVIGATIGVDWLYNAVEDFAYIAIRTVVVQIVSAVLLFLLVKTPDDYIVYAGITVFSAVGANVFNFIRSRKYATIRVTARLDLKRHLAPIMVLFGNAVAITVYVNMDVTLLGIFKSDYEVGIYSTAVKVYTIIKQVLNSLTVVSLPRISEMVARGDFEGHKRTITSMVNGLLVTVLPVVTVLLLMSDYVIVIVGGEAFAAAVTPLQILCFAAVPSLFAALVTTSILLPLRREKQVLVATVIGAVVNFLLNLALLGPMGSTGAAATTLIAETCVLVFALRYTEGRLSIKSSARSVLTSLIAVVAIVLVHVVCRLAIPYGAAGFFAEGMLSVAVFVCVLFARHDVMALKMANKVKGLVRKR